MDRCDAVMVPQSMAGGGDWQAKVRRAGAVARPLLGLSEGDMVTVPIDAYEGCFLVYAGKHDNNKSLLFHTNHERSGEERYEWLRRPDGVRLGKLRPE